MTSMLRVVCASANPDKVAEIAALLAGVVDLLPRPPEVPDVVEDADTLEGNARLKAVAICAATGLPAVADDTGLEVAALGGAPGVYTARFAGEDATYADNRAKLLAELDGNDERRARFRTVALLRYPDGTEIVAEGVCDGVIPPAARRRARLRVRRRVPTGRRRRPHLRRDERGRQARGLAPGAGVPGPRRTSAGGVGTRSRPIVGAARGRGVTGSRAGFRFLSRKG